MTSTVISDNMSQLEKTPSPILVTPFPMVTLVKFSHRSKAQSPMLITLSGMVMSVKEMHARKASSPIEVTLFGSVNSPDRPAGHKIRVVLNTFKDTIFEKL